MERRERSIAKTTEEAYRREREAAGAREEVERDLEKAKAEIYALQVKCMSIGCDGGRMMVPRPL